MAIFNLRRTGCVFFIASLFLFENTSAKDEAIEADSFWASRAIEIEEVQIQVLDKISGKVYRGKIKVGDPVAFGNLVILLKRAFKNDPSEDKEVYAYIEIYESPIDGPDMDVTVDRFGNQVIERINGKKIFAKYLFASSPAINQFQHPIYDVRVEFSSDNTNNNSNKKS